MTEIGRRERNKLAVRQALASATLSLAMERGGIETVTIEEITNRADVSLRTFRNYFASKYEALASIGADRARRIGESLVDEPAGEPLWDALTHAVLRHYEGTERAFDRATMTALWRTLQTPGMRGEYLKINFEMQTALAAAIAERTGIDIATDMYPEILAGAVVAATQVATRRWYAADPPVPLMPLIEKALRLLH